MANKKREGGKSQVKLQLIFTYREKTGPMNSARRKREHPLQDNPSKMEKKQSVSEGFANS